MKNIYLKPMVPTLVDTIPSGAEWIYEPKYDGFRALLYIFEDQVELISRNLKNLSTVFPEIISYVQNLLPGLQTYLPFVLDGEIVILESQYRASFEKIQERGRMKNKKKISQFINVFPADFIAFDLLMVSGRRLNHMPLMGRKEELASIFFTILENSQVQKRHTTHLKLIETFDDNELLWSKIVSENGEGIVAKRVTSKWIEGARTTNWLKIKNWKRANFFILSLEKQNSYFHVGLIKGDSIVHAGLFFHGLNEEERNALTEIIKKNAMKEDAKFIYLKPSICVELLFIDWYKAEIRQPRFSRFRFDIKWEDCTWEEAQKRSMK
ncbi:non-homologous end-joining DNA ligase [Calidifontibacillus erzurumensis]|uniref:non-homologous end-joining DNA ligase n=1 Tax=Calidifontibacillus erzurumensis TaxID=2741433 RepID=UPI001E5A16AF|nr:non-homologous end-joining DNA ligase [Calidifontibacillus erzurumensis]